MHLLFFCFSTSDGLLYSDPSSKAGVNVGDHGLLDRSAVHRHVMGKSGLHERGSLWTPTSWLKIHIFWDEHAHSALVADAASFHGGWGITHPPPQHLSICVCIISSVFNSFTSPPILLFSDACGKNHIGLNCVDREGTVLAAVLCYWSEVHKFRARGRWSDLSGA